MIQISHELVRHFQQASNKVLCSLFSPHVSFLVHCFSFVVDPLPSNLDKLRQSYDIEECVMTLPVSRTGGVAGMVKDNKDNRQYSGSVKAVYCMVATNN